MPCLKCTQPRYCSDTCRSQSWISYHQHECSGLDLLHSVGVAHLGLRIVLVTGFAKLLKFRSSKSEAAASADYRRVYDLLTHIDSLDAEDLFQYTVTSVLLGLYLQQRTKFLCDNAAILENLKLHDVDEANESFFQFICGLLLRHITQLVCNGHAIYEVGTCDTDLDDNDGPVVNNSQFRIATAIYPSASMMNHSCDPTVINSFFNQRLIVRAIKPVKAGGEVYNCYGPHFRHHPLPERQENLRGQYHFTCECTR